MDQFYSLTTIILFATCQLDDGLAWRWSCIKNKCIKDDNPETSTDSIQQSLSYCRLTCGPYGSIWPLPTGKVKLSADVIEIDPNRIYFDFSGVAADNKILRKPSKLIDDIGVAFVNDIRNSCGKCVTKTCDTELTVQIWTNTSKDVITWDTDESYTLQVKTNENRITADISAVTVFGARHALETLFQTTTCVTESEFNHVIMIKDSYIEDRPAYPHRGLLIDTSRHFLETNTIKRTLDAMSHSKMNVLHWHATDSQSFPLKLPRIPQLAKYGAYSNQKVYSIREIADLIEYGKKRGVRIIIEIDSPAHAGNGWQWGESAGFGKLAVCINNQPWQKFSIQPPSGQLNPVNEYTYRMLGLVYEDLFNVLPKGEAFHMGGDEVYIPCWNSTTEIIEYMNNEKIERNEEGFLKLWSYFHRKSVQILDNIVGNNDTIVILWSSNLSSPKWIDNYLNNKRFVIQTWVESFQGLPQQLLAKGYKLIISTKNAWYLDHGFWGRTVYYRWTTVYDNRLPSRDSGVYGGEVCMWGEYVDDAAIDSRIWPRASAAGERLWSNPVNGSLDAAYRFLSHRERLVRLGIKAEAVTPEWCYENEGSCLGYMN